MEQSDSIEPINVLVQAKSRTLSWHNINPPPYGIIKDLIRFTDAAVLLAASLVERIPDVQGALTATSDHNHLLANVVGGCIAFGTLNTSDGYKIRVLKKLGKQMKRLIVGIGIGTSGVFVSLTIMHHEQIELATGPLRWCFLSAVGLSFSRIISTAAIKSWIESGKLAKRVVLIGVDKATQTFINTSLKHTDTCKVVGIYTDQATSQTVQGNVKVLGPVSQLFSDSQKRMIDTIVISQPSTQELADIYQKISPVIADVQLIGHTSIGNIPPTKLTEVGGNVVLMIRSKPLTDWQRLQKNSFDLIVGGIALACLSPLMLFTAAAIKLESPGKVLFKQPRDGYNNLPFVTYKFRSMYSDRADMRADVQTTKGDARITRVGKIIRKFSIDELPQLFNVLLGDMSLVGPRPHAPGTKAGTKLFNDVVPEYRSRHRIKPGITGLAQINGFRGDTPDEQSIKKRVEFDLDYIDNWSLWLDIKIIILTVFREILSKRAF